VQVNQALPRVVTFFEVAVALSMLYGATTSGRDSDWIERPHFSRGEMVERAKAGDSRALFWFANEIAGMSARDPRQMEKVLGEAKQIGDQKIVIGAMVQWLKRYDTYFGYANPVEHKGPDGEIVVGFGPCDFQPPLQWTVEKALRDIVNDADASDMRNPTYSNHEWMAEKWNAWWQDRRRGELAKLSVDRVVELAANGDSAALFYMAATHEDASRVIHGWLGGEGISGQRELFLHAALALTGDQNSISWLSLEMRSLPLNETGREAALFEAVEHAGKHLQLVDALLAMMQMPGGDEFRVERMFCSSPSRNYMAARTLAKVVADPTAPALSSMNIARGEADVKRWLAWATLRGYLKPSVDE